MACRSCQLETEASLCQVCQYLAGDGSSELPAACAQCGVPIASPQETGRLCRVCRALLTVLRKSDWFAGAHAEWEQENIRLAVRKRELLGQQGQFAS